MVKHIAYHSSGQYNYREITVWHQCCVISVHDLLGSVLFILQGLFASKLAIGKLVRSRAVAVVYMNSKRFEK